MSDDPHRAIRSHALAVWGRHDAGWGISVTAADGGRPTIIIDVEHAGLDVPEVLSVNNQDVPIQVCITGPIIPY